MTIQPITYDLLREKGASDDEARALSRVFAGSAQTSINRAIKHAHDIDWDWAAWHLLSDSAGYAYDKAAGSAWDTCDKAIACAQDDYDRATAPARDAYLKAISSARADYDKAAASARADYNKATAPARAAYDEAAALAREAYNKVCAEAFARAYMAQENEQ